MNYISKKNGEMQMLVQYKWEAPELDKIWKGLYQENSYIFPYSSREYNENIFKYKKVKPTTLFQKDYFFVYYDNSDETTPLMIIPVYVKKQCVYIFGENISGAGNLDFIYSRYITDEQLFSAFKELGQYFKGMELKLYKINQRSRLYKFFENNYNTLSKLYDLKKEMDRVCVKIIFPNEYELYFQGLSRNSRSNLHKAYNKAKKTDAEMHLDVIHGPFKNKKLLSDLMRIYTKRESERKRRKRDFFPFIKHRYFSALTWAMENMDSHYTFCLFLQHRPAAFMSGFLTNFNEIVFPIVAMDSAFSHYAPGKVMISESIKYLQKNSQIRGLDLSRGDERYKLEMGGEKHYNYRFFLQY